ncbi:hypothetical protein [uncultured Clostridium sp.]|uniref:hypothetical protein n=1 Tax=uncultured Clostridium sp. TaxID=59620 RepID=UPI002628E91C|nr:hypothetical protein [uncultured Clostridium sp.]
MMLDLTIISEQYFDLKLLDGRVLNLKKMTQGMIITTTALDKAIAKANDNKDYEKVLNLNVDRLMLILNHNKEKINITKKDIESLTPEHMSAIIIAYTDWMQGINNDPN